MDGHGFVWLKINKLGGNCAPNYKANAKMMVFRIPKKPTALLRPKKHHFGVSFAIASIITHIYFLNKKKPKDGLCCANRPQR